MKYEKIKIKNWERKKDDWENGRKEIKKNKAQTIKKRMMKKKLEKQ